MRQLLIIVTFLVLPLVAKAQAPIFVQKFEAEKTGVGATSITAAASVGNAGANHLILCAGTLLIAATNVTFSDNVGLTWNPIVLPNVVQTSGTFLPTTAAMTDGNGTNQTYYAWASTGTSTTVNAPSMSWTTSVNTSSIHCIEESSVNLTTPIDTICTNNGPFVRHGGQPWPVVGGGFNCDLVTMSSNEIVVAIGQFQDAGSHLTLNGYTNMTVTGHDGMAQTLNTNALTYTTRAGGASSANGIIMGDAPATGWIRANVTNASTFTWGMLTAILVQGLNSNLGTSIMKGCTVSPTNTVGCSIPNGWVLLQADGFDTGSLGTGESLNRLAFESSFTHTGSKAVSFQTDGGGNNLQWTISAARVNARDTYASWWEFIDSSSAMNTNYFIGTRVSSTAHGDLYFDRDPYFSCNYNCAPNGAELQSYDEGSGGVPNFATFGPAINLKFGQWNQWEMHHRINDPNTANGMMELFLNGTLVMKIINTNYSGARDGVEYNIQVAGDYEDLIGYDDAGHTICASPAKVPDFNAGNYTNWTATTNPCPLQSPPNGHGPTFNQYIDDIIILTCPTPGTCNTIAPGTTLTPNVKVTSGMTIK